MQWFNVIAILITLTAAFAYLNYRFIKLPMTIGLMLMSLVTSIGLIILGQLGFTIADQARHLVNSIHFETVLLEGMLGLLLFAGALHVNLNDLLEQKWEVGVFATLGVGCSTLLVGTMTYLVCSWMTIDLSFIGCLLFGALISPTDPIAVLAILRKLGAPARLEIKLVGESLFNDGIAVVVFLALLGIATGHEQSLGHVSLLFAWEAIGGAVLGFLLGLIAYRILKTVDDYDVEILVTLALVIGGYALASAMHTSGPIAMVIAGLLIGNHGRKFAMSEKTRDHLDAFWELIDVILNGLLFVLVGLEVLVLTLSGRYLLAGVIAIPVVLLARLASIGIPVSLMQRYREFVPNAVTILTWAGLRGGIAVALALHPDLPPAGRELILTMTYVVVCFSILVQGTTIKHVVAKALKQ